MSKHHPNKSPEIYAESLMAVDDRGRLVLDRRAMMESGVMDRQFRAANRLYDILHVKKQKLVRRD